jgi:hypothetical protein
LLFVSPVALKAGAEMLRVLESKNGGSQSTLRAIETVSQTKDIADCKALVKRKVSMAVFAPQIKGKLKCY